MKKLTFINAHGDQFVAESMENAETLRTYAQNRSPLVGMTTRIPNCTTVRVPCFTGPVEANSAGGLNEPENSGSNPS